MLKTDATTRSKYACILRTTAADMDKLRMTLHLVTPHVFTSALIDAMALLD